MAHVHGYENDTSPRSSTRAVVTPGIGSGAEPRSWMGNDVTWKNSFTAEDLSAPRQIDACGLHTHLTNRHTSSSSDHSRIPAPPRHRTLLARCVSTEGLTTLLKILLCPSCRSIATLLLRCQLAKYMECMCQGMCARVVAR